MKWGIQIFYLHNIVSVENSTRMTTIPVFPYRTLHLFRDTKQKTQENPSKQSPFLVFQ